MEDRLKQVQVLLARLPELVDDELNDLERILVQDIEVAASSRDIDTARILNAGIEKIRAELRNRAEREEATEVELEELVSQARGDAVEPQASVEPPDQPRQLPRISDLARRRTRPLPTHSSDVGLVTPEGVSLPDVASVAAAFNDRLHSLASQPNSTGRFRVARASWQLDDDRRLSSDPVENRRIIDAVISPEALVASGGVCAPIEPRYEILTAVSNARPLRDALPHFGADRGGIRFVPPSRIVDFDAATDVISESEDAAGATKPCLTVVCPDVDEVLVSAVTRCLQLGNFHARTHPEHVEHVTQLAIINQTRLAEETLWTSMCSASTAVTSGEVLSLARDVFATINRAAAQYRSRHRLPDEIAIRFAAPSWLRDAMRADLARQLPGDDTLSVADARIAAWFANSHVLPVWTPDASQHFGAQAAGALLPWPDSVETLMFAEGTFLFLDGGSLDLGVVRDSTLNRTNDFQVFAETFEAVAFVGTESYCLTMDLCASGLSAGMDNDVNALLCVSGS